MKALKFLRAGGAGPFSDVTWPPPGTWLDAAGDPVGVCRTAVHACAVEDLPLWLGDELWRVELRGSIVQGHGKLAAPAGRLVDRVDAWDEDAAIAYGDACAERAAVLAADADEVAGTLADDARRCARRAGRPDLSAPTLAAGAAMCAARIRGLAEPGGVAAERAWQAAWLAGRLGL